MLHFSRLAHSCIYCKSFKMCALEKINDILKDECAGRTVFEQNNRLWFSFMDINMTSTRSKNACYKNVAPPSWWLVIVSTLYLIISFSVQVKRRLFIHVKVYANRKFRKTNLSKSLNLLGIFKKKYANVWQLMLIIK